MFVQDFIINGSPMGEFAEQLQSVRFDAGLLRPYIDQHGRKCVTVNTGKKRFNDKTRRWEPIYEKRTLKELAHMDVELPVTNAASLRKDEWIELDTQILRAARARLRAWTDLTSAASFGGFNAMARTVLEHETMSDPGEAIVDMDGLTEGRTDSPLYQLEGLPLPITHSDFWFSSRRLAAGRNMGTPLDSTMAEAAGRRVAEMIEKTVIGVQTGITYGKSTEYSRTSSVYGYTNFPDRITKTDLTVPDGTNADETVDDVLEMRDLLYDAHRYGPYMLYHSTDWDRYMDDDYVPSGGNNPNTTLRQRLKAIDGIQDVRRLDFLTSDENPFTLIMVQMTSDVVRAINGMGITTIQWDAVGGMRKNFKVLAIQVPQLRSDYSGSTGILHATTA